MLSDKKFCDISGIGCIVNCGYRIVQEIDLHSFVLSSICLSNSGQTLVSGSTTGAVQLFNYPLSLPGEWREWRVHGDAVTFIKALTQTSHTLVYTWLELFLVLL